VRKVSGAGKSIHLNLLVERRLKTLVTAFSRRVRAAAVRLARTLLEQKTDPALSGHRTRARRQIVAGSASSQREARLGRLTPSGVGPVPRRRVLGERVHRVGTKQQPGMRLRFQGARGVSASVRHTPGADETGKTASHSGLACPSPRLRANQSGDNTTPCPFIICFARSHAESGHRKRADEVRPRGLTRCRRLREGDPVTRSCEACARWLAGFFRPVSAEERLTSDRIRLMPESGQLVLARQEEARAGLLGSQLPARTPRLGKARGASFTVGPRTGSVLRFRRTAKRSHRLPRVGSSPLATSHRVRAER
jgi:hypothetical protein